MSGECEGWLERWAGPGACAPGRCKLGLVAIDAGF